ncbi:hypothetical protein [Kineosporia succinea]|uniref:Uncharacterized protein n=1 Tax=Kineosporia succinea TaxID=84632 RepID=A0ABT9NVF9_9ACTN|nr:hypothetical protein [Kineosporia succinea]MDP9824413.1 hypothetical protein [Kineosporia succinea]
MTIDEPAADADWISGRLPLPNTNAHIHAATPVATQANSHSSEPGAPKAEVRANAAKDIAPRLTETFDAQAARFVDNVRARVDEMLGALAISLDLSGSQESARAAHMDARSKLGIPRGVIARRQ